MEKSGFQEHLKLSHETYMFVCAFHAFKYQSLHLATLAFLFILTLSHVRRFVTPWTEAHQAPLSTEFSSHLLNWQVDSLSLHPLGSLVIQTVFSI